MSDKSLEELKEIDWFIRKRLRSYAEAGSYVEDTNVKEIVDLFTRQMEAAQRKAALEVWEYIAKTPVDKDDILNLDKDPSGNTYDIEYHYAPPRDYAV